MSDAARLTPYQLLGGEAALRGLVDRFYELMNTMPETAAVRGMHPEDLSGSKDKLFKFLSGWLGGPHLYWQEFGHPRLRLRHLPFSIGRAEAEQWLCAMRNALDETPMDRSLRDELFRALAQTAHHMVNRVE